MTDALEDHSQYWGTAITNLCLAEDIDGLAGKEELANSIECLGKGSTANSMICFLASYILAISNVILGRVPICDNAHRAYGNFKVLPHDTLLLAPGPDFPLSHSILMLS